MTIYISLLRGINLGSHKAMRMPDLKALYESLDLGNVKTYVQSGNVVFTSDENAATLTSKISKAIEQKFGFTVDVLLCTLEEWRKLKKTNPFIQDSAKDPKNFHITLLDKVPDEQTIKGVGEVNAGDDEYAIVDNVIYLYCPNGYGRSKLVNNFWEKKLKVTATTRNWNTVNNLLELAEAIAT